MLLETFPDGTSENLLLYGVGGSGKTTQAAQVLNALMQESGRPAVAYITDWGSCAPLYALQGGGLLEVVRYHAGQDPFVWVEQAVQGLVPGPQGGWIKPAVPLCAVLIESLSGLGDLLLDAIGRSTMAGQGSDALKAPVLAIKTEAGSIKVPSNSPAHYGMAQRHLLAKIWQSQLLPCPVIWTAHEDIASPAKRDEQGNVRAEVAVAPGVLGMIGPLVAGHILTMHLGKYFVYTFRLKQEVTPAGVDHVLYTARHKDGLYEGLATNRAPLAAKVPTLYKPADVVRALQDLKAARGKTP